MTDNEREEFVKPKCENCETLRPGGIIKLDRDGKCSKCGKQLALPIPPLNRVQVERRPREHYKAKYINTRGWLLITIAAGIAEAVILIFTLFGKG